jgi:hypothetical protein
MVATAHSYFYFKQQSCRKLSPGSFIFGSSLLVIDYAERVSSYFCPGSLFVACLHL